MTHRPTLTQWFHLFRACGATAPEAAFMAVSRSLRQLGIAFSLFWGIRMPAFLTRLSVAMSKPGVQDGALYACSVLTLLLLGFVLPYLPN